MVVRTATCACEQLRVTCTSDPMKISLCHCLDCQKRTGSTFGVAAFFPRKDIEASGAFRTYVPCAVAISQSVYNERRHGWVSSSN